MLFNSLEFIFVFLPLSLIVYHVLSRPRLEVWRQPFLMLASLGFYAVGSFKFTLILAVSTAANLGLACLIQHLRDRNARQAMNLVLATGIAANVLYLIYFKYTNFLIGNFDGIFGWRIPCANIILPLGISFYTFQFIASLVDVARGEIKRLRPWYFLSFALFFPHLLAGPIVHYQELVPQMELPPRRSRTLSNIAIGLAIFSIGLFKKTVLADTMSIYADRVFDNAAHGAGVGVVFGWLAAASFTLQLYFDFSAYSDMAIGIARMFGFRLPLNFHSPLRAASIADYWRRWHMTLQRFLVSYLFQPLAIPLSRWAVEHDLGRWPTFWVSVALPTLVTFVIIGAWHGAGWTYVVFGVMHGIYLTVFEFWRLATHRRTRGARRAAAVDQTGYRHLWANVLTLIAVLFANVMFRAADVPTALAMFRSMLGFGAGHLAAAVPALGALPNALAVLLGFAIVLSFSNTQQILQRYSPVFDWEKWRHVALPWITWQWRLKSVPALATGVIFCLGVVFVMRGEARFIYFKF
jgi:D-alanyl-lipoteichoic acid acyltransferase DltB (MBOAT superfamily)